MAPSSLVALLSDTSARDDALLLLIEVTCENEEIQKLVAFSNAFDVLLELIRSAGSITAGSIVVSDALQLLNNLLRDNQLNQKFFRESSCIQRLLPLLLPLVPADSQRAVQQKLAPSSTSSPAPSNSASTNRYSVFVYYYYFFFLCVAEHHLLCVRVPVCVCYFLLCSCFFFLSLHLNTNE